jgi:hypothetical protein
MSARLTKPQAALLEEMRQSSTGGLWINPSKRYGRTAEALRVRGMARITDSGMGQSFYEPVPEPHVSGGDGV